jgi:hypothetical protein
VEGEIHAEIGNDKGIIREIGSSCGNGNKIGRELVRNGNESDE